MYLLAQLQEEVIKWDNIWERASETKLSEDKATCLLIPFLNVPPGLYPTLAGSSVSIFIDLIYSRKSIVVEFTVNVVDDDDKTVTAHEYIPGTF